MQDYNTREIRAAARGVNNLANRLESLKSSKIQRARKSIQGFQGDTISAIQDQLDKLSEEIQYIYRTLDNSADALYEFARQLDIADDKAKAMIDSN